MLNALFDILQKPARYERTAAKFWDDAYIATQMLKAHLDNETEAASRKPAFISRSVDWISTMSPSGAHLLDIGCGPGLYTKCLAEKNLHVTGMDISQNSLAYAQEHDSKTHYILQNYLTLDYAEAFDTIILIYCDYGALTPDERHNLLRRVYSALKPNGLFIFDVFTPYEEPAREDRKWWELHENGGFWSPTRHIVLEGQYYYGERIDVSRIIVIEEESLTCHNIWNTNFTKQTLLNEVKPAGFSSCAFYANAMGDAFTETNRTMCIVMTK